MCEMRRFRGAECELRLADALLVSETRHKTIASLYRVIVAAPAPSTGAASLRRSPWTADDLRTPLRHFSVTDVGAYAHETKAGTLYGCLEDSLGDQAKGTRHLAAVAYHHDHPKRQGNTQPVSTHGAVHVAGRRELGARAYAYDGRLSLREKPGRRRHTPRLPEQRLRLRKHTALAHEMLTA
jgi:hypothetical protein